LAAVREFALTQNPLVDVVMDNEVDENNFPRGCSTDGDSFWNTNAASTRVCTTESDNAACLCRLQVPACGFTDGTTPNIGTCSCGETGVCRAGVGLVCSPVEGCKTSPMCTDTSGGGPNDGVCTCVATRGQDEHGCQDAENCPAVECTPSTGLVCSNNVCSRAPPCAHTSGNTPNDKTCG